MSRGIVLTVRPPFFSTLNNYRSSWHEPLKVTVVLVAFLPERLVLTRRPVLVTQPAVVSLLLVTGTCPVWIQIHTLATFVGN